MRWPRNKGDGQAKREGAMQRALVAEIERMNAILVPPSLVREAIAGLIGPSDGGNAIATAMKLSCLLDQRNGEAR